MRVDVKRADTGESVGGSVVLEAPDRGAVRFMPVAAGVYTLDHVVLDEGVCPLVTPFTHTVTPVPTVGAMADPLDRAEHLLDALIGGDRAGEDGVKRSKNGARMELTVRLARYE